MLVVVTVVVDVAVVVVDVVVDEDLVKRVMEITNGLGACAAFDPV